jgi:hypothetical protein
MLDRAGKRGRPSLSGGRKPMKAIYMKDQALWEEAQRIADLQDKSLSDIIEDLLRRYLSGTI